MTSRKLAGRIWLTNFVFALGVLGYLSLTGCPPTTPPANPPDASDAALTPPPRDSALPTALVDAALFDAGGSTPDLCCCLPSVRCRRLPAAHELPERAGEGAGRPLDPVGERRPLHMQGGSEREDHRGCDRERRRLRQPLEGFDVNRGEEEANASCKTRYSRG